jgi:hypothetical protein
MSQTKRFVTVITHMRGGGGPAPSPETKVHTALWAPASATLTTHAQKNSPAKKAPKSDTPKKPPEKN